LYVRGAPTRTRADGARRRANAASFPLLPFPFPFPFRSEGGGGGGGGGGGVAILRLHGVAGIFAGGGRDGRDGEMGEGGRHNTTTFSRMVVLLVE